MSRPTYLILAVFLFKNFSLGHAIEKASSSSSSTSSCINNPEYLYKETFPKTTCAWIRWNEQRRQRLCLNQTVRKECPQSCGLCCEDDTSYTFADEFSFTVRNCKWIESTPMTRKNKYCNKHKDGRMIRDACPKSCNFCKSEVVLGDNDDDEEEQEVGTGNNGEDDDENNESQSSNNTTTNDDGAAALGVVVASASLVFGILVMHNNRRRRIHVITSKEFRNAKKRNVGRTAVTNEAQQASSFDVEQGRTHELKDYEVKDVGVSIYWMKHHFLADCIGKLGLHSRSTVKDIEHALRYTPTHERCTGIAVKCQLDAVVDEIEEREHVGNANIMLGNCNEEFTLEEIVNTLWEFATIQNLDPKKTFVWVSFLCNKKMNLIYNQKLYRSTMQRISRIGKLVTIVIPWAGPDHFITDLGKYEIFNAMVIPECKIHIVMTPSDCKNLNDDYIRKEDKLRELFETIKSIKAFDEKEIERIWDVILGNRLEHDEFVMNFELLLKEWAKSEILTALEHHEPPTLEDALVDEYYASLCAQVGDVLTNANWDNDVLKLYKKAIGIYKNLPTDKTGEIASLHAKVGAVLKQNGDIKGAIRQYKRFDELKRKKCSNNNAKKEITKARRSRRLLLVRKRRKYRFDRFPHPKKASSQHAKNLEVIISFDDREST